MTDVDPAILAGLLADPDVPPEVAIVASIIDEPQQPNRQLSWTVWAFTLFVVLGLLWLFW